MLTHEWPEDAATSKLASATATMASAPAGSIRSHTHLAAAFVMSFECVAMRVHRLSKRGAPEMRVNASWTRAAAAGCAAPLQHDAIEHWRGCALPKSGGGQL